MKKIIFYVCCALSLVAYVAMFKGLLTNDGPMTLLGLIEFIGFAFIGAIALLNMEKKTEKYRWTCKEEKEWYRKQGY